jgi:hypothetical protein
MAFAMPQNWKSIILRSDGYNKEAIVDVTDAPDSKFTPGLMVRYTAADPTSVDKDTVQVNDVAESPGAPLVVIEDELQGNGIYQAAASDSYGAPPNSDLFEFSAGDIVQVRQARSGEQYLMVLHVPAAGGDITITKGDRLACSATGTLKAPAAAPVGEIVRALTTVVGADDPADDKLYYVPVEVL